MDKKRSFSVMLFTALSFFMTALMVLGLANMIISVLPYYGTSLEFQAWKPIWWTMIIMLSFSIVVSAVISVGLYKLRRWGRLLSIILSPFFLGVIVMFALSPKSPKIFSYEFIFITAVIYLAWGVIFNSTKVKNQFGRS
jgi:hypothetical protein